MNSIGDLIPYLCFGVILLIVGIVFRWVKIKKINGWIGYRTASSKSNQENWDKANKYFPRAMIKAGSLSTILGIILYLRFKSSVTVYMTYMIINPVVALVYMFLSTEKYLKNN
ncbi:SdpI family protein [Clostridium folliculivorans]|uniref:SdpI family protein n=1 Tax=Clostridium folliculivorans TaxID=2886038 RepID=A0A9W6DAG3_9CLOT|nr:SdpI family protein [Clostridium folliculivorans]GKU25184.1 hypothetical protein CFOLD11_20100 [Clostridium folliculivorans]GKU31282.1 hypothetical protein CFB3_33890 [Clostridium folliculivorans]